MSYLQFSSRFRLKKNLNFLKLFLLTVLYVLTFVYLTLRKRLHWYRYHSLHRPRLFLADSFFPQNCFILYRVQISIRSPLELLHNVK